MRFGRLAFGIIIRVGVGLSCPAPYGINLIGANALGNSAVVSTTVGYLEIKAALEGMESAFALSRVVAPETLEYEAPVWDEDGDDEDEDCYTEHAVEAEDVVSDAVDSALSEAGFFAAMTTLDDPASIAVSLDVVIAHFARVDYIELIESYMAYVGRHIRHDTLLVSYRLGLIPDVDMTDEIRRLTEDAKAAWSGIREAEGIAANGFIPDDEAEVARLREHIAMRLECIEAYTDRLSGLDDKIMETAVAASGSA